MNEVKVRCEVCGKMFEKGYSIANHKKWHNPDFRRRCNDPKYGRKFSPSTRKRIKQLGARAKYILKIYSQKVIYWKIKA